MCDYTKSNALIERLRAALCSSADRQQLLQQFQTIRAILNDISARQWLFEQIQWTEDSTVAPDDPALKLIISLMKASGMIWRGGLISPEIYDEAHSRTWEWFLKRLHTYDPSRASFTTWFNNKLKWIIQDLIRGKIGELPLYPDEENWNDPPAPAPDQWHETVEDWFELVKNDLRLSSVRMQNHPHVNCQAVLIELLTVLRDPREFEWDKIAPHITSTPKPSN
ncbi:MAG: hypothetical protein AAGC54_10310, partial [Cyanobacteria bacterium P01_F01_bin.4]